MLESIREMVLRTLVELVVKDLLEKGLRPGDSETITKILSEAEIVDR